MQTLLNGLRAALPNTAEYWFELFLNLLLWEDPRGCLEQGQLHTSESNFLFSSLSLASAVKRRSLLFLFHYMVFSRTPRMTMTYRETRWALEQLLTQGFFSCLPPSSNTCLPPALTTQPNSTFFFGKTVTNFWNTHQLTLLLPTSNQNLTNCQNPIPAHGLSGTGIKPWIWYSRPHWLCAQTLRDPRRFIN